MTRNSYNAPLQHPQIKYFNWDPYKRVLPNDAFLNIDAAINLLGENLAHKRWNEKQKEKILNSRVEGTKALIEGINKFTDAPLKVFSSASAIGIYQKNEKAMYLNEESLLDNDFLGSTCQKWENESKKLTKTHRKCIFRIGVVLGKEGGLLKKLYPIFFLGGGGQIGKGKQYMSWIHLDDLVDIFVESLTNENFDGVFNAVSPFPITNKVFTKALGLAITRPTLFPVPPFALKLMMGEMATLALDGQQIFPARLQELVFDFKFPRVVNALEDIFS